MNQVLAQKDPNMGAAGMRAFFRIAEAWGLTMEDQRVLLGSPARQTVYNWKKGQGVNGLSHDLITRLSYIVGIYKALRILFRNQTFADAWMKQPNDHFSGKAPLSLALHGDITDLAELRRYLDAARG